MEWIGCIEWIGWVARENRVNTQSIHSIRSISRECLDRQSGQSRQNGCRVGSVHRMHAHSVYSSDECRVDTVLYLCQRIEYIEWMQSLECKHNGCTLCLHYVHVQGVLSPLSTLHAVCCSVLQCAAVCCSVLQCVAVCCSVLQCIKSSIHSTLVNRVNGVDILVNTVNRMDVE